VAARTGDRHESLPSSGVSFEASEVRNPGVASQPGALDVQSRPPSAQRAVCALSQQFQQIPEELFQFQGDELVEFTFCISAIDDALDLFRRQIELPAKDQISIQWAELEGASVFGNAHPLRLLRKCIAACPESLPAAGTSDLPFVAETGLRNTLSIEISDVGRAIAGREWRAATILGGAVLEAILYWSLKAMTTELAGFQHKPPKPIDDWQLSQMIDVARGLKIIEESTKKLAHIARDARNLVHPAVVHKERRSCDKATSQTVAAAIEAVVRDIGAFCLVAGRKF
jgi:hypothetical protein